MDAWVIWLLIAVLLAAGEIATTSFYLAPFAMGAAGGGFIALIGGDQFWAVTVAMILTAVAFLFLRPIAQRHLMQPAHTRTGTDRLVGQGAIVTAAIAPGPQPGAIKLDGETWTARAYDEDRAFAAGTSVQVVEIRGATAMVAD